MTSRDVLDAIADDIVDNASLADILRKVMIFDTDFGTTELGLWARNELYGYENSLAVPEYRRVLAPAYMSSTSGPPGSGWNHIPIEELENLLPESERGHLSDVIGLTGSVKQIEFMCEQEMGIRGHVFFGFDGPDYLEIFLHDYKRIEYPLIEAVVLHRLIQKVSIAGVLDRTKTYVTDVVSHLRYISLSKVLTADDVRKVTHQVFYAQGWHGMQTIPTARHRSEG